MEAQILRDHANIMRSLADELDNIADVLDKDNGLPPVGVVPQVARKEYLNLDTVMETKVTYKVSSKFNYDGMVPMIRHDLMRKHTVVLVFEPASSMPITITTEEEFEENQNEIRARI